LSLLTFFASSWPGFPAIAPPKRRDGWRDKVRPIEETVTEGIGGYQARIYGGDGSRR
jgi:hypothetical protein